MAWPKHKNPTTKGRIAHAPYNFVPLPEKVVTVNRGELPGHDLYDNLRHTGYIDCVLTTESPLYIRGTLTPEEFAKQTEQEIQEKEGKEVPFKEKIANKPDFFYTNKKTEPVIPGSSLRGMLRTLLEIVSYSKVDGVFEKKLYYRAVADPTLGRDYRREISRVKAGYVIKRNDGSFAIAPAQNIQGRTFFKVHEGRLRSIRNLNFKPMYNRNGKKNEEYEPQYLQVWFNPPTGRDRQGRPIDTVQDVSDRKGVCSNFGVVVCSGFIERKTKHSLVTARSNGTPLKIPEDIVEDHRDSLTYFQKTKPFDKQNGCLIDGRPIFYIEQNGEVEWFGHTRNFRIPYRQGDKIATPLDFVPESLRRNDDLDLAEAIFGFIGKSKNGKNDSYASRVFVTNAYCEPEQANPHLTDEPIIPRILAGPKPTTFQHYLVQTLPDETRTLKHYGSRPEQETVIRGHKLYWHKGEVLVDDIEEQEIDKESPDNDMASEGEAVREDKTHTLMQPLRTGVCFRFRIYFENLADEELGTLLWVLKLPGDDPDSYRHKLGMGKPYGMGSVKLEATLHVTDRQLRPDRSGRYDQLFEGEGQWATGEVSVPENINISVQSIKAFEQYVLARVCTDQSKVERLAELERIQTLLRLLEWPGPKDLELTEYMSIEPNEYRYRPVLPTPLPILYKRGITRVRVKNYKSLGEVNVRLGQLTILVGLNGAGKSNFIDVLQFVAQGIENLNRAIEARGGISLLRRWSSPDEPPHTISITLNVEDDLLQGEFHIEIASDPDGYHVERERCSIYAENEFTAYEISNGILERSLPELEYAQISPSELHLKTVSRRAPFDRLYSILSQLVAYSILPENLVEPQRADSKPPLNKQGTNLAATLKAMEKSESEWLDEIKQELGQVVTDIGDLQVQELGGYFVIKFKHDWGEERSALLDARQESDGTLRLLSLLTALYQDQVPWLVAVEEPETAIHPGALQVLYGAMKVTSKHRSQVIITTHSPDLIDTANITDLRSVEKSEGVTLIDEIDEAQRELAYKKLFTPGELMRMSGFRRGE